MKTSTGFIALIHLLYIIIIMWFAPLLISKFKLRCKYYKIYVIIIILQVLHWFMSESKNECILSYWEKKNENKNYIKGSEPEKTYAWNLLQNVTGLSIKTIQNQHEHLSRTVFVILIIMIVTQCKLNQAQMFQAYLYIYLTMNFINFDSAKMTSNNADNI